MEVVVPQSVCEGSAKSAGTQALHALSLEDAVERVQGSLAGLTQSEAARRLAELGPNELPEQQRVPSWVILLRQFKSPLIYLLIAAAGLAAALREWTDAGVILGVLCVNALIGAFQEGRAERSMAALRRLSSVTARVYRDGRELALESRLLVPGDLLLVAAGDAVAADARILEAFQLEVSEASLTGESLPVAKHTDALDTETHLSDRKNMLYAGTHVTAGRARAVVTATGQHAEIGKIAALAESSKLQRTPLQQRVEQLGRYLVMGGVSAFLLVILVGLARGLAFQEILLVAMSQLVSVVPEGLPVAMTIALSVGMQRMAQRGAIVRKLSAVESLGSTTVICTDKTGTLTRNELTITSVYLADGRTVQVEGVGYAPVGRLSTGTVTVDTRDPALSALCQAAALCNDAQLDKDQSGYKVLGDPLEGALLVLVEKAGLRVGELRRGHPRLEEIPFDANIKMMATRDARGVYIKGAPEQVFELVRRADNGERLARAEQAVQSMARAGLRVLALARVDSACDSGLSFRELRGAPELLGLVGATDPARPEAASAIARCRDAGIRTVMLTGDHEVTGMRIARDLGLAGVHDRALDDRALGQLNERQLLAEVSTVAVFARVQPAQKLRIVAALRGRNEVVAMTGDGVNDAPALAQSHVGVAMGSGSEAAKQAADIVITDDNFATIVEAVEQGRLVYRNLQKVLLLLLSSGLAELLVVLLAIALGWPLPFLAVQILWNNVITEGTITVNLTMDPAQGDEMSRAPVPLGQALIPSAMLPRLGLLSFSIVAVTLGFFGSQLALGVDLPHARTTTFTLLAVCEWFNVLNCRSESRSALSFDIFRNPWLLGGLLLSNLLQLAVVYVPALNRLFHTEPLALSEVAAIGAIGSLVLWTEEVRKWFSRRAVQRRCNDRSDS